jgi:AmmeMemoRadiSam system protein B/AmmeMemoRadiSam system protein A
MNNKTSLVGLVTVICFVGLLGSASCKEKSEARSTNQMPTAQANSAPEGSNAMNQKSTNEPAFRPQVAGSFYPADPDELRSMMREYLNDARKAGQRVAGDLLGVIVPHAGYPYSGPIAAHAFQAFVDRPIKRVVVLGPAHRRAYAIPALLDAPAYHTPLGDIPIDRDGVRRLAATKAAVVDTTKFVGEHALEVELPFLQMVLKDFSIVPVMISEPDPKAALRLAQALKDTFPANDTVIVASSDMSHDYPYQVATALDENALRYVTALDTAGLYKAHRAFYDAGMDITVSKDGRPVPDAAQFCGLGTVLTLLELAKRYQSSGAGAQAIVLDRRNSGDIVGDKRSRIVGYSAVAVTTTGARAESKHEPSGSTGDFLSEAEKQELLTIARQTLEAYLKNDKVLEFTPKSTKLQEPGAAFVTLHKHGDLRGCIGYMEPISPLWQMIRDRAIDAAIHDNRFSPVKFKELADISIEISVLSPRVEVKDPLKDIQIGRDGVWLELGMARGVFLPQVPVEQNWTTVEEYLDNLCYKAHVSQRGCWKSSDAKIMRFTALVFSEKEKD